MSWRDRVDDDHEDGAPGDVGRFGGDFRGMRPAFDSIMSWSLPLGRFAGISVRVHWLFLVLIVAQLLRASIGGSSGATIGMAPMLLLLLGLFWSVLLHEFGHCFACRAVGGSASEVLLWPLGGLAWCSSPARWSAHLITAAGGPLVNLAIIALLGPLLGGLTGRWLGVALPNPLSLNGLLVVDHSWWLMATYLFLWTNVVLLAFNLLPIYPLDGGRILQAALWPRLGYAPAARIAVRVGFIGGILLGVLALVRNELLLLLVALFALSVCQSSVRQLEFSERMLGYPPGPDGDSDETPDWETQRREREADREAQLAAAEAEEIDRILRKINDSGLDSLTVRERRLLADATERRRRGQDSAGS